MNLDATAVGLAKKLVAKNIRVVFAESCTAGMAAATLAGIPGISDFLCGSAVTYRNQTKQDWLGVSAADLERFTAVSEQVVGQMAAGVLLRTVEADYSAAVTGHLGPGAPEGMDGVIYIGVAARISNGIEVLDVRRFPLDCKTRLERQQEATAILLECLGEQI